MTPTDLHALQPGDRVSTDHEGDPVAGVVDRVGADRALFVWKGGLARNRVFFRWEDDIESFLPFGSSPHDGFLKSLTRLPPA